MFHLRYFCFAGNSVSMHQASVDSLLNMSLDDISAAESSGGKTGVPLTGEAHRSAPYTRGDSSKSGDNARLYVGNLSWETTWQGLKDYFKQAGEVSETQVPHDRRAS